MGCANSQCQGREYSTSREFFRAIALDCFIHIQTLQSVTKIDEIHAAPYLDLSRIQKKVSKTQRYKNTDLPHGTVTKFSSLTIPMACDSAGTLRPWVVLSSEEIANVWNLVFQPNYIISDSHDEKGSLDDVVRHLVRRTLSTL